DRRLGAADHHAHDPAQRAAAVVDGRAAADVDLAVAVEVTGDPCPAVFSLGPAILPIEAAQNPNQLHVVDGRAADHVPGVEDEAGPVVGAGIGDAVAVL